MKWRKLFLQLLPKKKQQSKLIGYAVIEKDDISSKSRWVTFNGEGNDRFQYEPGDPLILFPDKMKEEACIEMYID